jgi:hypothetical protein
VTGPAPTVAIHSSLRSYPFDGRPPPNEPTVKSARVSSLSLLITHDSLLLLFAFCSCLACSHFTQSTGNRPFDRSERGPQRAHLLVGVELALFASCGAEKTRFSTHAASQSRTRRCFCLLFPKPYALSPVFLSSPKQKIPASIKDNRVRISFLQFVIMDSESKESPGAPGLSLYEEHKVSRMRTLQIKYLESRL